MSVPHLPNKNISEIIPASRVVPQISQTPSNPKYCRNILLSYFNCYTSSSILLAMQKVNG
jgi:hypothetical protein